MWFEVEDRGPVRWLFFNRPEKRNAIPGPGWGDLSHAFEEFSSSRQRILVIAGRGGSFCSGADLDPAQAETGAGLAQRYQRMKVVGKAAMTLHRLNKPTIAAVDGVAAGAGMNIALGCDVVVASSRARFSEIFVRRGLTLDFGGTWLLPRVVGLQRAKELAFSGRIVEAEEAVRIGLALEVVAVEHLEERVEEIALSFLGGGPTGQMFAKKGLNRSFGSSLSAALDWEGQGQSICFSTEEVAEGMAAFLEKRPPHFE